MAWDPAVPATNADLVSAPVRGNFAALDTMLVAPVTAAAAELVLKVGAGDVVATIPGGTNGHVLTLTGGVPGWSALPPDVGFANPMTAVGDLIRGGTSGAPTRLAPGTNGHFLTLSAGVPAWQALPVDPGFANPMTTAADLIMGGASGVPTRLAKGATTGHVLTVTGASTIGWQVLPVDPGFANPMTGVGDLIRGGTSGAPTRLAPGTNGHFLTLTAGVPAWAAAPGFTNPMTTAGDLIVGGASGAPGRLADVAVGSVLSSAGVGVAPGWSTTPIVASLTLSSHVITEELAAAPASPPANSVALYSRTSGVAYRKTADGIESPFQVVHGSVRLVRTSGTVLTLSPFNGNGLWVFNSGTSTWRFRTIPGAGLTLTSTSCRINNVAAQPVVANTTYLVTVGDVSGTLTLHLWTTLTHAPDATTGVEIMAGTPFQTVVGLVRANASATFQDNLAGRMIASWFNRRRRSLNTTFTTTRATSSASLVELHTEIRAEFVTWGDENVECGFVGSVANSTANTISNTLLTIDGSGTGSVQVATTSAANMTDVAVTALSTAPAEGYHYATIYGNVAAGTGTWAASCLLTGSVVQ